MLSAEPTLPYSPPAMADHFITGSEAHLWRNRDCPEQMGVDYRKSAEVSNLNADANQLLLNDAQTIQYDRLVIATGSRLHASLVGADMPGVHNFKSLNAAESIVEQVRKGEAKTAGQAQR